MFHSLPHYMKLYDVLKGAYSNYKAGWSLLVKRKLKSSVVCCSMLGWFNKDTFQLKTYGAEKIPFLSG